MSRLNKLRLNTTFLNNEILKSFDCGDSRLNDFFANEAPQLDEENIFATSVFLDENERVVGFYTTSASLLTIDDNDDFKKSTARDVPMDEYSAIKIQYFAIDKDFQDQGIGTLMMKRLINDVFSADINYNIGFKVLYLEALTRAMDFYETFGFNYLRQREESLILPSSIMIMNYEELSDLVTL